MKNVIDFLNYLKFEKGFSDYTIKNYQIDLNEFSEFLNKTKLNYLEINTIRKFLKEMYEKKYQNRTISRKISALKSYYKYLASENIIKDNPMLLISNPKIEKSLPNYLNYKDLNNLLNAPDTKTKEGKRDALILEMLYSTGTRVSELTQIKINDINLSERQILILGKGNKERYVYYGHDCMQKLNDYLLEFNPKEYLFVNKHGNKLNERMVREIINNNAKKAHLTVHVSPHTLRHTYATHMLNEGADLKSVGDLLGHESLSTTQIYTHVSNERLREVYLHAHPRAKKR